MLCAAIPLAASAAQERGQLPLHARQLEAMGVEFAPVTRETQPPASLDLPARVMIPPDQLQVLSAPAAGLLAQ